MSKARENKWRDDVATELDRAGFTKEAMEFRRCRSPESVFGYRVCHNDPAHYTKRIGHTCHLRICPECGRAESARLVKQYFPHVLAAADSGHERFGLKHMILTTDTRVSDPKAWEVYRRNWKNIDLLFDELLGKGWHAGGRGTIASAEFGEEGAKLHYHIVFYGEYIEQAEISRVWAKLTDCPVVWIRKVYNVRKAVKEICKYAAKLTMLDPVDTVKAFTIIKGSRRVRTRGLFYNLPPVEEEKQTKCKCCGADLEIWDEERMLHWPDHQRILSAIGHSLYLITGNKSDSPHQQTETRQILAYEMER